MNDIKSTFIDAHAHCGIIDRYPPQSFEDYLAHVKSSPIEGVVMFSPVAEIYERDDPDFHDNMHWRNQREASNQYLLGLQDRELEVIPYFFIWNDFAVDQLTENHRGIKWHRHADEPEYNYDDPACHAAIDEIRRRNMPVVLEEELRNTIRFINELAAGVRVIIPHLGFLNGGYRAIEKAGLWENPWVYTDTSLAAPETILAYVNTYGHERIMFGSDFPFGHPPAELEKIRRLGFSEEVEQAINGGNLKKLLKDSNRISG
ncbi:MAG: amidohydrolase family protein [Desulfobacterales bacterium]